MSNIGRNIYGYCNGFLSCDEWSTKRIEAEGVDWIVVRSIEKEEAEPIFASFTESWASHKQRLIDEWSIKPEDY